MSTKYVHKMTQSSALKLPKVPSITSIDLLPVLSTTYQDRQPYFTQTWHKGKKVHENCIVNVFVLQLYFVLAADHLT